MDSPPVHVRSSDAGPSGVLPLDIESRPLSRALEYLPDRVYAIDRARRRVYSNLADRLFLGVITPERVLGFSEAQRHPAEIAALVAERDEEVLATGESLPDSREQHRAADGQLRWFQVSRLPLRDESGSVIGLLAIARDISESVVRENQLIQLSQAVEQSPASVVITDTTGRIEYVNEKFLRTTGYTAEEVIGQNPRVLKSGHTPANEYRRLWDLITRGEHWTGIFQNKKKNGDLYWERAHISPIRSPEGQITHFLAVKEDITERQKAADQLHLSQALLAEALSLARIGCWEFDLRARHFVIEDSLAALLEAPQAGKRGVRVEQEDFLTRFVAPPDHERLRDALRCAAASSDPAFRWQGEICHITASGREVPAMMRLSVIAQSDGAVTRLVGASQDISDLKQAEAERSRMEVQLRHAQKLESIGQLAAGMAHEINTPTQYIGDNIRFLRESLAGLKHYIDVLEDPAMQCCPEQIQQMRGEMDIDFLLVEMPRALDECAQGIDRVSSIVRAMKDFSHIEDAGKDFTDLNQAIETTLLVTSHAWESVAEVVLDLDPRLPPVYCHRDGINQVLLHLIINAAQAIADCPGAPGARKGQISITTRGRDDAVELLVRDDGTGIAPAILGKIFDPFFTTKPPGKGTGQGLSIVHAVVVEQHAGTVHVASTPGVGTAFTVRLPLKMP